MAYNIWGYHPKTKEPKCFALHVPPNEEKEYLARAKAEGWTGLVVDRATKSPDEGTEWTESNASE